MTWLPQAQVQAIGQFLQAHPLFDAALGIVIMMVLLSVVFTLINRPERAANDPEIKRALEEFQKGNPDQLKLLWEYALHADGVFNDRQNFFLLFESILLGGVFAIIAAVTHVHIGVLSQLLTAIAFLGLLTTISWWYIQLRQHYVLSCLIVFHRKVTPVYGSVISRIRQRPYRIDGGLFLVYILPLVVSCLWTALLLYV